MADFDGGNHQRLVVNAPAFAARFPTHIGFVHLDVPIRLAADPILVGSHHARAELVQDAESRLVTGQAKLPLELHRRHAGRLAGDEVGRPEPDAEGHMTALHHRAHGQARLAAAGPASQDAGPGGDAERFAHNAAVGAGKAFAPACLFQIGGAGGVVGEKPLELGERFREGEVGAIENATLLSASDTLALRAVCVNRTIMLSEGI